MHSIKTSFAVNNNKQTFVENTQINTNQYKILQKFLEQKISVPCYRDQCGCVVQPYDRPKDWVNGVVLVGLQNTDEKYSKDKNDNSDSDDDDHSTLVKFILLEKDNIGTCESCNKPCIIHECSKCAGTFCQFCTKNDDDDPDLTKYYCTVCLTKFKENPPIKIYSIVQNVEHIIYQSLSLDQAQQQYKKIQKNPKYHDVQLVESYLEMCYFDGISEIEPLEESD